MTSGAPLPVREYASVAEMQRHAAEVRARLFAPRPLRVAVAVESPAEMPAQVSEEPPATKAWAEPKVQQISFIAPEPVGPKGYHNPSLHPIRRMLSMVSFVTGVLQIEMRSERRSAPVSKARQILFYICKSYTLHSLPEIGRRIGDKDHTSVLHGVRRVQDAIKFCNIQFSDDPMVMASRLWAAEWPKWAR